MYDVAYQNGTASYTATPLVGGKLNELMWGDILLPSEPQHSGTEALLRRYVEALQKGIPDYDDMTPQLAAEVRGDYAFFRSIVQPLGAEKTITYTGGGWNGLDTFEATYANGKMKWIVSPLENGKLSTIGGTTTELVGPGHRAETYVGFLHYRPKMCRLRKGSAFDFAVDAP